MPLINVFTVIIHTSHLSPKGVEHAKSKGHWCVLCYKHVVGIKDITLYFELVSNISMRANTYNHKNKSMHATTLTNDDNDDNPSHYLGTYYVRRKRYGANAGPLAIPTHRHTPSHLKTTPPLHTSTNRYIFSHLIQTHPSCLKHRHTYHSYTHLFTPTYMYSCLHTLYRHTSSHAHIHTSSYPKHIYTSEPYSYRSTYSPHIQCECH